MSVSYFIHFLTDATTTQRVECAVVGVCCHREHLGSQSQWMWRNCRDLWMEFLTPRNHVKG